MDAAAISALKFDEKGLIPAILQDWRDGTVLMVAYMNREAFDETVRSGHACYFSRSRNRLWRKGEESGNFQIVHEIRIDCDADAIVIAVEQRGDAAACHLGYESCFFRKLDHDGNWQITDARKVDPAKYGPGYGHPKKSAG